MAAAHNPKGRKSDKFWRDALQIAVNEKDPKTGLKYLRLIAQRVVVEALKGNMSAVHEIGDRLDGRTVTVQGDPNNPIQVIERIERVIIEASAALGDTAEDTDTEGIPTTH